jgi:hypothetical protein
MINASQRPPDAREEALSCIVQHVIELGHENLTKPDIAAVIDAELAQGSIGTALATLPPGIPQVVTAVSS